MKKLVVTVSVALLAAASFGGAADARPGKGRGHAYGHYKHHRPAYGYVAPRRHRNNAAIAAGITGAIIGGALSATTQPTYRRYSRPAYGYYSSPRRTYYREEYYNYGY